MKFMHLGDLHLGRSLGDYDLKEDQRYILEQLLELCLEHEVDAVLMAGDIYDKAIPSEAAVNLLNDFLCRLAKAGISAFLISGNHDSDDRLNFGSSLLQDNRVYIDAVFHGEPAKHTLEDEFGLVNIYGLPFVKASQVKHFFAENTIDTYEEAVKTVLEAAGVDRTQRNVLLAHQFVTGEGEDPALGGSEGLAVQSVGLVEKISYRVFQDFDYVALGHIHGPQQVGRETVRYAGSPLKYSLSEVNNIKSVPIITLGKKGDVAVETVLLKPQRDLRHLRGTLKELLDKENVHQPENFIYATLTDEDIVNDAMGIFRTVYPNTVKIDYDNAHTRAVEQVDISRIAENKSFEELIGDFYRMMYGCEISEEEMAVMRMAAREAGVMDEAD